jgi:cyclic pyranopterin phosphate synthase
MPAEDIPIVARGERRPLLSIEKLIASVCWLVQHAPIERVKLTGGEPLVRSGLDDLISRLAHIPGIHEISLTTNGSLLAPRAQALKMAGLARVNVSLDSLDAQRFAEFSRGGRLEDTMEGIDAAIAVGLVPLKLNAVLQRSTWRLDVPPLLDLAAERGLEIRFIELMRMGTERAWSDSEFVSVEEVKAWLSRQSSMSEIATPAALPARQTLMLWKGTLLKVGWIAPRSHPFCASFERLRMDARGRIRRCLMDPETFNLVRLRFAQQDEPGLAVSFRAYLTGKHLPLEMDSESAMSQIGG